ncbi:TetR/AcrR family transcriptional regulator [Jatrophihabitans sp. YIM 134969]
MADKPFHHGNLRDELLTRARQTLRSSGEDALSLRQLAREAGVSHGAPRRHFTERQDLLDALARLGFEELTTTVAAAAEAAGDDPPAAFRAVARAYIDFAVVDPALMDLMFTTKNHRADPGIAEAAEGFFAAVGAVIERVMPTPGIGAVGGVRRQLVLASTLHGIASLVAAGRIDPAQIDQLVDDAGQVFGVAPRTRRRR